jgi:hypothetical protein
MFSPVDIHNELAKAKLKHQEIQKSLLQQANEELKKGKQVDEYILKRLHSAPKPGKWEINADKLDKNRIFSIDDIKAVCINYRLRFLDTKYYKMEELPYDAVIALKELEKQVGSEVKTTKLAAPAKFFKLEDRHKDPMLFAQIDNNNYYLIHKWGNDMAWYKKWLAYPFRNLFSLLISMIVCGIPFAYLLPYAIWHTTKEIQYYQQLFLACLVLYTAFTMVFCGFTFYRRFSKVCWNSPYFN